MVGSGGCEKSPESDALTEFNDEYINKTRKTKTATLDDLHRIIIWIDDSSVMLKPVVYTSSVSLKHPLWLGKENRNEKQKSRSVSFLHAP